jgi:hypothetical protein
MRSFHVPFWEQRGGCPHQLSFVFFAKQEERSLEEWTRWSDSKDLRREEAIEEKPCYLWSVTISIVRMLWLGICHGLEMILSTEPSQEDALLSITPILEHFYIT